MTDTTLLYRQIHPNFVVDGVVASLAFRPNAADRGLMSVYDGDLISAERSWTHYTTIVGRQSNGVQGLDVAECTVEGLTARPDPEPFPEHAVIDFNDLDEKQWKAKAKKLQSKAHSRGWLFRSDDLG